MKSRLPHKTLLYATPLIVAIVVVGVSIYFYFKLDPSFVNLQPLSDGKLSEAQNQTISMITELNKYLISLGTLMFGVIGFYLTKYKQEIHVNYVGPAFLISLILLGLVYYYAFRVYVQLTGELAQNALAIQPGQSRILYYLQMEFWTSLGSSLVLLFLFVYVFYIGRKY